MERFSISYRCASSFQLKGKYEIFTMFKSILTWLRQRANWSSGNNDHHDNNARSNHNHGYNYDDSYTCNYDHCAVANNYIAAAYKHYNINSAASRNDYYCPLCDDYFNHSRDKHYLNCNYYKYLNKYHNHNSAANNNFDDGSNNNFYASTDHDNNSAKPNTIPKGRRF